MNGIYNTTKGTIPFPCPFSCSAQQSETSCCDCSSLGMCFKRTQQCMCVWSSAGWYYVGTSSISMVCCIPILLILISLFVLYPVRLRVRHLSTMIWCDASTSRSHHRSVSVSPFTVISRYIVRSSPLLISCSPLLTPHSIVLRNEFECDEGIRVWKTHNQRSSIDGWHDGTMDGWADSREQLTDVIKQSDDDDHVMYIDQMRYGVLS